MCCHSVLVLLMTCTCSNKTSYSVVGVDLDTLFSHVASGRSQRALGLVVVVVVVVVVTSSSRVVKKCVNGFKCEFRRRRAIDCFHIFTK